MYSIDKSRTSKWAFPQFWQQHQNTIKMTDKWWSKSKKPQQYSTKVHATHLRNSMKVRSSRNKANQLILPSTSPRVVVISRSSSSPVASPVVASLIATPISASILVHGVTSGFARITRVVVTENQQSRFFIWEILISKLNVYRIKLSNA